MLSSILDAIHSFLTVEYEEIAFLAFLCLRSTYKMGIIYASHD